MEHVEDGRPILHRKVAQELRKEEGCHSRHPTTRLTCKTKRDSYYRNASPHRPATRTHQSWQCAAQSSPGVKTSKRSRDRRAGKPQCTCKARHAASCMELIHQSILYMRVVYTDCDIRTTSYYWVAQQETCKRLRPSQSCWLSGQ